MMFIIDPEEIEIEEQMDAPVIRRDLVPSDITVDRLLELSPDRYKIVKEVGEDFVVDVFNVFLKMLRQSTQEPWRTKRRPFWIDSSTISPEVGVRKVFLGFFEHGDGDYVSGAPNTPAIQYLVSTKIPHQDITKATVIQIIALLLHGFGLADALTGNQSIGRVSDPMIGHPDSFHDMMFPSNGFFVSKLET